MPDTTRFHRSTLTSEQGAPHEYSNNKVQPLCVERVVFSYNALMILSPEFDVLLPQL
jgi:hypothetical protein